MKPRLFDTYERRIREFRPLADDTRLANFWMYGYFLLLGDERMAKFSGQFLRICDLEEYGVDALAFRYLCLTAH
jgi:cysteinyl-tRNA synthetase